MNQQVFSLRLMISIFLFNGDRSMFQPWHLINISSKCREPSRIYQYRSFTSSFILEQNYEVSFISNFRVRLILTLKSSLLVLGGGFAFTIKLSLINLYLMKIQRRQEIIKYSLQQPDYFALSFEQMKMFINPSVSSFIFFQLHYFIFLQRLVTTSFTFLAGSSEVEQTAIIFYISFDNQLIYLINIIQNRLNSTQLLMRKSIPKLRAMESTRPPSVHFRYESEEGPSQIEQDRNYELFQSHISDRDSDETVKTTNFHSNRIENGSLSGFAVPPFYLTTDSSFDPNTNLTQSRKKERQQFYTFLEKFGKDQPESNSEIFDFHEEETVCYQASTGFRKNSHSSNIFDSKAKSNQKNINKEIQFSIKQSNEQDLNKFSGLTKKNQYGDNEKMINKVSIFTQTSPIKKCFHYQKLVRHKTQDDQLINLSFTKFRPSEEEGGRRNPPRIARESGRLKFWKNQRIDYSLGGYWRLNN